MIYFWYRRDLRLHDNAALYHALNKGKPVQAIFIFDKNILDKLTDKTDPRVEFIHNQIINIQKELEDIGASLNVYYGKPDEVWKDIIANTQVDAIYTNNDYESYAIERDALIKKIAAENEVAFKPYKDHVIFESHEVLKADGTPYIVFTPYKRKWLEKFYSRKGYYHKSYPTEKYFENFAKAAPSKIPSLQDMGFKQSAIAIPSKEVPRTIIKKYDEQRNYPAINGTSKLGIHFRFGTISIRDKAKKALELNETYLSELIWRDFYSQILAHFPHVEHKAFRAKYEAIEWRNNEAEFELWKKGKTGYPMVDAGMRELNKTGHMHNRVRMVVASFLTKHLLIDWRWGEAYFAEKLLDFDLSSNNGGWQWAAGCGTDAAPYFRIFNPESQMKKFDKELRYIKKWVPEYGSDEYPEPMVDHKMARERCLATYKSCLAQN